MLVECIPVPYLHEHYHILRMFSGYLRTYIELGTNAINWLPLLRQFSFMLFDFHLKVS